MASIVHRVRYYNAKPQPINCVSFNKISKHIAVARGDASIEIWDLNYAPYLIKFIPGLKNGSVEALGWVKDRLLSTGLEGTLIEWDLDKLCLKTMVLLTGYAAWCLDVNPSNSLVAVGTEQGYVNLYSVDNDEIIYHKLFDKQEGRILCCKFCHTGNVLVTGSINTIRLWSVETGHALIRMSLSHRGTEVIVWCLGILSDNTIVSGDSLGRLTFWDSSLGDQLESYSTHKADILSIAVSDDEKSLFCSGVDPVITNFIKVQSSGKETEAQWVKNTHRNIHEHDVRGLVIHGEQLISIGVDGYLTFSSYPPKWVMRLPPMIPAPRSLVSCRKRLLLLRYSTRMEVWKLGSYETKSGNMLVTNINTKGKNQIKCCALSPNGELLVYSTASVVRMLKLESDEELNNISLSKVLINGLPEGGCDRVSFTDDSSTMVAHTAGTLHVLQVDPEAGATPIQTISLGKYLKAISILHLYISKESPRGVTYLVVADTLGCIAVWTQTNKKFEFYVCLPTYQCVPSALTVDSQKENLIVTYVDQKIVEYALQEKRFTSWPGAALPPQWQSRRSAVMSICAHPTRDAVLFQDESSLWIMENTTEQTLSELAEPLAKRKSQPASENVALNIVPIKYLADFHWLEKEEAVTLEVLPEKIISQLPPLAATKRHGHIL